MNHETSYLIVLGRGLNREGIVQIFDKHPEVSDWVYSLENAFMVKTTLDPEQLFNIIYATDQTEPKSQFIIVEVIGRYSGLLPEKHWTILPTFSPEMFYKDRENIKDEDKAKRKET